MIDWSNLYAEILAEPADHVVRYAAAARDEAHLENT